MSCKHSERLKDYLEEKLSSQEMEQVEDHLDDCSYCQSELDELIDKSMEMPSKPIEIDDEVLVSKIKARRKGMRRIAIYGFLGFALGFFSHNYTADSFIVTKAIMALPYKLAEFALGIFFSGNALSEWEQLRYGFMTGMGYFPYHPILGAIVELITPAIIATFIAIMIGYLVSDKRVFRRKKIVSFIVTGAVVFMLWVGVVHGVYSSALNKIDNLEDIKAAIIYDKDKRSTRWLLRIDQYNLGQSDYSRIISGISAAKEAEFTSDFNDQVGFQLLIEFSGGGQVFAHVDVDNGKMLVNRNLYQLSDETVELMKSVTGVRRNE